MREDFWEFAPTHKLMLCTNHRPEIKETKNAIWRRIKLIPFTVTIPESEQVKDLAKRLARSTPEFWPGAFADASIGSEMASRSLRKCPMRRPSTVLNRMFSPRF